MKPLYRTKEHLHPKSKGGSNKTINIKACCNLCNNWRGNKRLQLFKDDIAYCLNNNIKRFGYTKQDFEFMIYNIEHIMEYVVKNSDKLKNAKA